MKALGAFLGFWTGTAIYNYVRQWDSLTDWLHRDGLTLFWWSGPVAFVIIIFASIPDEEESK